MKKQNVILLIICAIVFFLLRKKSSQTDTASFVEQPSVLGLSNQVGVKSDMVRVKSFTEGSAIQKWIMENPNSIDPITADRLVPRSFYTSDYNSAIWAV